MLRSCTFLEGSQWYKWARVNFRCSTSFALIWCLCEVSKTELNRYQTSLSAEVRLTLTWAEAPLPDLSPSFWFRHPSFPFPQRTAAAQDQFQSGVVGLWPGAKHRRASDCAAHSSLFTGAGRSKAGTQHTCVVTPPCCASTSASLGDTNLQQISETLHFQLDFEPNETPLIRSATPRRDVVALGL